MSDPQINVVQLREALGWTQQQLATACGVDRSTVSKWESEPPTKGPALILLRQIHERAKVIGAGPETFAAEEPPTPSRPSAEPPLPPQAGVEDGRQDGDPLPTADCRLPETSAAHAIAEAAE